MQFRNITLLDLTKVVFFIKSRENIWVFVQQLLTVSYIIQGILLIRKVLIIRKITLIYSVRKQLNLMKKLIHSDFETFINQRLY